MKSVLSLDRPSRRWEPGGVRNLPKVTRGSQCPVVLALRHHLESAPGICIASRGDNEPVPKHLQETPPHIPWEADTELGLLLSAVFQGVRTDRGHAGTWTKECAAGRASEGIFWYLPFWSPRRPAAGDPRVGQGLRPLLAQRAAIGVLLFE